MNPLAGYYLHEIPFLEWGGEQPDAGFEHWLDEQRKQELFGMPRLDQIAEATIPPHMVGAPSILDAIPQTEIPVRIFDDFKEGPVLAPVVPIFRTA